MTKEEELKQQACQFAEWINQQGYVTCIEYAGNTQGVWKKKDGLPGKPTEELYSAYLDRNLSDVEKFRKTLIKEIEGDFTDNFRWRTVTEHCEAIKTTRRIVDIIKDFKLP